MAEKKQKSKKNAIKAIDPKSKRRKNKKNKKKIKRGFFSFLFRLISYFLLGVFVVGVTSITLYGIELSRKYKLDERALDGVLWELPSRVYARPLELYVGKKLSLKDLKRELELLDYEESKSLSRPGTYHFDDNKVFIHKKSFIFSDGREDDKSIKIELENDKIVELIDLEFHSDIAIERLDPLLLGSIYPKHAEDRLLIDLDDTPQILIDTLLATEDRRFYSHFGIDLRGLARAAKHAFQSGKVTQGASTITQQFIKNHYLSNDKKISRKIKEAIMAIIIESKHSKKQILEGYLNEIFLGQDGRRAIHGFGLAAEHYFGRPLKTLRLHEIAALVALVKEPSRANPYRNPEFAKKRRKVILDVMISQNLISKEDADIAKNISLKLVKKESINQKKGYYSFLQLVYKQLNEQYDRGKLSSGLNVFTTLDPIIQEKNERSIEKTLKNLEEKKGYSTKKFLQTAVVMVETSSAEIVSIIGDRVPDRIGFNRATQSKRPPGSLLKPIVFMSALEYPQKYTLTTKISDFPFTYRVKGEAWSPKNYSKKNKGYVTLLDSLVHSYNIPTARVALDIGINDFVGRLEDLGARKNLPRYPSISLGSVGMSPLEVTQIYEGLANGGYYMPLRAIRSITDVNGQMIERYPLQSIKVISEGPHYIITKALQQVVSRGTAKKLEKLLPGELNVAGKTGTTDDYRDSWFAGFTGNYLNVVWIGNDNNKKTGLSGSKGAMEAWANMMKKHNLEKLNPPIPSGIAEYDVNLDSGKLLSFSCKGKVRQAKLPFLYGSEPTSKNYCAFPNLRNQEERNDITNNKDDGWFRSFDEKDSSQESNNLGNL